jgi:para-aminobenzoate synthetase component 1
MLHQVEYPMPSRRLQPVPELSEITPAEMAARLQALEGIVFFDSARETDASISMLASNRGALIQGNLFNERDFLCLREQVLRLTPPSALPDDGLPRSILGGTIDYDGTFEFAHYADILIFSHREGRWYASNPWWRELPLARASHPDPQVARIHFTPTISETDFCAWVARVQEYIQSGDIYQANLSHRLEAFWPGGDPWSLYEALRHYSPAPYGAFLRQTNRCVLSSSPELFLQISGNTIRTRPIKGTRPRRADLHADERSAFDLITSPKEVAELIMITDLERNDLGQVCDWGSVTVSEMLKLERHEQVFHLVSTVDGRLRRDVDAATALKACFPGGSITGAPKKRAREVIDEIEPVPRGLYTGAIGWFGEGGESSFSIAIRTIIQEGQILHFHVGAGIVADSVPTQEWRETWDKAAGMLLAAQRVQDSMPIRVPSAIRFPADQY